MLNTKQLESMRALVVKYDALSETDLRRHQEAEVRTNFIDPLFSLLGWVMDDRTHVERETTVLEGKRPDYSLKIGGVPRLFLEAKPFREDIYDRAETRKAITKAYNKGVPWVAATNFARLVLYDAHEELTEDRPRRVLDIGHEDYVADDSEATIELLTPKSLATGVLEDYAQKIGARRRTVSIEKRLYQSMRTWREQLFNALYLVKRWKTDTEFHRGDEAIQRLLDRLLFLRNCEDRGIAGTDLRGLRNRIRSHDRNLRVTDALLKIFAEAADTYDSELFQQHSRIDELMQGMGTILDESLSQVIEGLYSVPRSYSDYNFSQMEPDVLGEVYEQYLGYVPQRVRKLSQQSAAPRYEPEQIALEAKSQRRKAQGIYYTPRWVVQRIVQQTLGSFLEEHRHRPDVIDSVTILDPACGSGSFLIRAYETLLEHHASEMGVDEDHLDGATRERILRRNIFGVDLDPQAVEIARLNLLIRMVREQERLPELKGNVQHGNSLVEGGEADLRPFFGEDWRAKGAFSWTDRFRPVMEDGGFDIIVGNPPYVGFQGLPDPDKAYFRHQYATAQSRFDLYIPFIERAIALLKPGGLLGFICPTNFMKRQHGKAIRDLLLTNTTLLSIHDFEDVRAFDSALNYTGIVVLKKSVPPSGHLVTYSARDLGSGTYDVPQSSLAAGPWVFRKPENQALIDRGLGVRTSELGDMAQGISEGIVTGKNAVFVVTQRDVERHGLEAAVVRKAVRGKDVKRYGLSWDQTMLIYPYAEHGDDTEPLEEREFSMRFPNAYAYLSARRGELQGRDYFDRSTKLWYELWCERDIRHQGTVKLVTPELAPRARFAPCDADLFYLDTICGLTLKAGVPESLLYVLAILNSAWGDYWYRSTTVPKANGYLIYKTMFLKKFPVRRLDLAQREERQAHDALREHAERLIDLSDRITLKGDTHDYEREQLTCEIEDVDRRIDDLVFDLYGLTIDEREVIGAAVRS